MIVARHVPMRGVVTLFVLLAGGEGEAESVRRFALRGRGARTAHGAGRAGMMETVPVPSSRLEAGRLDMDRMRQIGRRGLAALARDFLERLVFGQLPMHGRGLARRFAGIEPKHQPGP
ncbi:MAG: hypothetical protein FD124_3961 [Alphaproteobacteria bacterium]|nr:MAG: hypothetical protein FD124_3961 [Alphaproteobacteria bacterium]